MPCHKALVLIAESSLSAGSGVATFQSFEALLSQVSKRDLGHPALSTRHGDWGFGGDSGRISNGFVARTCKDHSRVNFLIAQRNAV